MIANIHFEDNGQDVQMFTVSFYPDFKFGEVISADMQNSVWKGFCVLSGKPKKGDLITISKGPKEEVIQFKHKVIKMEIVEPAKEPATGMTRTHNVLGEDVTIEWEKSERIERHDSGCAHFLLIGLGSDGQEYEAVGVYQGDELQGIENIQTI